MADDRPLPIEIEITDRVTPRRAAFLSLASDIEGQLRDAYDERHQNHGVTQAGIAKALGVNRSAVNHRLRGLINMTIETLADMVWALGYAIKVTIYDPAKTREKAGVARGGDGLMGTKIEPIRGVFEDWRSLLAHLMEIDEIESVVVVTVHKDGTMHSAHLGFTAGELALAGAVLQRRALGDD